MTKDDDNEVEFVKEIVPHGITPSAARTTNRLTRVLQTKQSLGPRDNISRTQVLCLKKSAGRNENWDDDDDDEDNNEDESFRWDTGSHDHENEKNRDMSDSEAPSKCSTQPSRAIDVAPCRTGLHDKSYMGWCKIIHVLAWL